jgi:hypothetical protein
VLYIAVSGTRLLAQHFHPEREWPDAGHEFNHGRQAVTSACQNTCAGQQANTRKNSSSDLFSFRADNDLRSWHQPKSPLLKSAYGKIVRW